MRKAWLTELKIEEAIERKDVDAALASIGDLRKLHYQPELALDYTMDLYRQLTVASVVAARSKN